MDRSEKLIIVRASIGQQASKRPVVRVADDVYRELCMMAADTHRSVSYIADAAIRFGLSRAEVVNECED